MLPFKYKDVDGIPTCWKAEARSWYKRILRKLYVKYCGDAYIPRPTKIVLSKEKQRIHPRYGQVTHIVLHGDGYDVNGTYIIGQFGTEIIE